MAGTLAGGRKAARQNKAKHGKDYYQRIGQMGGRAGHTGGFASMSKAKASAAGRRGGTVSSRAPHGTGPKLSVRRARATRKLKTYDGFDDLFIMDEPFTEGFGKSRWWEKVINKVRGK